MHKSMDAGSTFIIENNNGSDIIAYNASNFFRNLKYNSSSYGGVFEDYVETTEHPGTLLFIGVLFFVLASQALVPLFVAIGDERARLRKLKKLRKEQESHAGQSNDSKTPPRPSNGEANEDVASPYLAHWGDCMEMGFREGENAFEENDDLSFFERVEKEICDREASLDCITCNDLPTSERSWSDVGLRPISTQFCCAGPELQNNASVMEVISPSGGANPRIDTTDEGDSKKRKTPGNLADVKRQSSIISCDSEMSNTPSTKRGREKMRAARKKMKRTIKSITQATPRAISKNVNHNGDLQKMPKTNFLDGGFFGPRKYQNHLYFLESQMMNEEAKDLKRETKKQRRIIKKSRSINRHQTDVEMRQYHPPSLNDTASSDLKKNTETNSRTNPGGSNYPMQNDVHLRFDDISIGDLSIAEYSLGEMRHYSTPDDEQMFAEQTASRGKLELSEYHSNLLAVYHPSRIKEALVAVFGIVKFDHESCRILSLMAPFTITAMVGKIFDGVDMVIISSFLGTDALAAYSVTGYFVGLTYEILKGFTDALCSLSSNAIGAGKYHLAGQYIQLSIIMFSLAGIPFIFIWGMFTYDMLISFGMSENVAQMGQQWALVSVVACVFNGLNESFFQFSSVVDPDVHSNVIAVLMSAAQTASVSLTLYRYQYADLLHVALVKMTVIIIFIAINVIYCSCRGWLDLYWDGLMKSNALNNRVAVTQFLKTGIPLGIGAVARESEWGGLLLLASEMGPAEVSAWAIVRTFWGKTPQVHSR